MKVCEQCEKGANQHCPFCHGKWVIEMSLREEILDILWYPEKEDFLKKNFPLTHETLKLHIDEKTDKILKLFEKRIDEIFTKRRDFTITSEELRTAEFLQQEFKELLK